MKGARNPLPRTPHLAENQPLGNPPTVSAMVQYAEGYDSRNIAHTHLQERSDCKTKVLIPRQETRLQVTDHLHRIATEDINNNRNKPCY